MSISVPHDDTMKPNIEAENRASPFIRIDANPLPLRLPIGSALFVIRGEVWLTQDGCTADFILGAGRRFDVNRRGSILVSATQGGARLYVARPAIAAAARPAIPDYLRGERGAIGSRAASPAHDVAWHRARSLIERVRALLALHARAATT
ncbi:MAG: hypothetical protein OHK0044_27590 [Burkholderiaceae bacterium]